MQDNNPQPEDINQSVDIDTTSNEPVQSPTEAPSTSGFEAVRPADDEIVEGRPGFASMEPIKWQAAEHVEHSRDNMWFLWFGLVVVMLILIAIFLMNSWTFAILIPVMAVALIMYIRRPAIVHSYTVSSKGIYINEKLRPYQEFKSFGVVEDDLDHSIMLIPRRRFQPAVTVYVPEDLGEEIVDALAARLPMVPVRLDMIDRLLHILRI